MSALPRARSAATRTVAVTGPPPPELAYLQAIGRLIDARADAGQTVLRCRVPVWLTRFIQAELGQAGYVVTWLYRGRHVPTGRLEIEWTPRLLQTYAAMQASTAFMAAPTAEYVFRNGLPRVDTTSPDTWWHRLWGRDIDTYVQVTVTAAEPADD
ncbi:hypothetical protein [Deinococcus rufus]|uniref:Uncharacterized protein n=1 Tax=Deinococcus rufus TaxID=2136097 RepID=A0ABV7ZAZ0_9DEIO